MMKKALVFFTTFLLLVSGLAKTPQNPNPSQQRADSALRDSLENLQNRLEQLNEKIEFHKKKQEQNNQKLNRLIQEVERKNTIIDSLRKETIQREQQKMKQQTDLDPEAENIKNYYNKSLNLFRDKKYKEAANHFILLLEDYPQHALAGNFAYWAGESYYGLEDYQEALKFFNKVKNYPHSPKNDDALLMAGQSLLRIGKKEEANDKFQTLLDKYPESEYADLVREYFQ